MYCDIPSILGLSSQARPSWDEGFAGGPNWTRPVAAWAPLSLAAPENARRRVVWPKKLAGMLADPGPVDEPTIAGVHLRLTQAFPAA